MQVSFIQHDLEGIALFWNLNIRRDIYLLNTIYYFIFRGTAGTQEELKVVLELGG